MLLDLSLTFALRLLIPLAAILPPSWLYALARGVGTAMLPILERRRLRVRANMQRLQPRWSPEQLDRAVTQQFQETAAYYVDLALLPRRTPEWIFQRRLLCEGLEHLDAAVAAGRGVVLAGLHLSNPEVPFQTLAARNLEAITIVQRLPNRRRLRLLQRLRQARGLRFVPADLDGIRDALETLKRGGVVAVLSDRDIQGRGLCVPFAGRPARFPTGAVDLAQRTGATLIPAFCVRLHHDHFRVIFLPPEPLTAGDNRQLDLQVNLARLVERFEPYIRDHVTQWRVFESPWKACRDAGLGEDHG